MLREIVALATETIGGATILDGGYAASTEVAMAHIYIRVMLCYAYTAP